MTESLDIRRKRLVFRSWHRGTRESDLLLGSFADRHVGAFEQEEVDAYERLLTEDDADLWDWITGAADPPPAHDTKVMILLRNFRYRPVTK